jgi:AraC-like DNA-binding protein
MGTTRFNDAKTQKGIHFDKYAGYGSEMRDDHYHPHHELYYLVEGECKYFIGNSTYEIKSGDLVIIPPRVIHRTIYNGKFRRRVLINCPASYIPEPVLRQMGEIPHILRNPEIIEELQRYFKLIEKEYVTNDPFAQTMLRCYARELYVLIARSEIPSRVEAVTNDTVAFVLDHVRAHYSERITLEDMAKRCAVSMSHLSKTFKAETGLGFSDYLSTLRLEKAETLLKVNKDMSITDVAFACGFNDSNYFSDKFKKEFGISPLKYKKQN